MSYDRQRIGRVECVACVEKQYIASGGHIDGLVHGIVESVVGLTDAHYLVAHGGSAVALLIVVYVFEGVVVRVAIDDEMFHTTIGLRFHTMDGTGYEVARIPCDGSYCDLYAFFLRGRRHTGFLSCFHCESALRKRKRVV